MSLRDSLRNGLEPTHAGIVTTRHVAELCDFAMTHGCGAICVASDFVGYVRKHLGQKPIAVNTVLGRPDGLTLSQALAYEGQCSLHFGAYFLNVPMNIGAVKERNQDMVRLNFGELTARLPVGQVRLIIDLGIMTWDDVKWLLGQATHCGIKQFLLCREFCAGLVIPEDVKRLLACLWEVIQADSVNIAVAGDFRRAEQAIPLLDLGVSSVITPYASIVLADFDATAQATTSEDGHPAVTADVLEAHPD